MILNQFLRRFAVWFVTRVDHYYYSNLITRDQSKFAVKPITSRTKTNGFSYNNDIPQAKNLFVHRTTIRVSINLTKQI